MNDILPQQTSYWQFLEHTLAKLLAGYGYQEIRFPLVEKTELFKRSIGEVTDIVEKEMYTFLDRNEDSLSLRPEGTAVCVRAGIEHGLLYNQIQRLWYLGPMFRHERPQKGRYRQFHQLGVEAFGMAGPDIDAELIALTARLWQSLGLDASQLQLQLNSLGSLAARQQYRKVLVDYFTQHFAQLDDDSKRRLQSNPLRILDSKNPALQQINGQAPKLLDYLDAESQEHFAQLCQYLDQLGIHYQVNPRLVRGLDYYNRTVFEWVTEQLGAQGTICAGGRYDSLVEQLGGKSTPAVGFAIGLERLIALVKQIQNAIPNTQQPQVYLISVGQKPRETALLLAEALRTALPELRLLTDCSEAGIKSQFKRADASGAQVALVLGENELNTNRINIKYLRETQPEAAVALDYVKLYQAGGSNTELTNILAGLIDSFKARIAFSQ